MENSTKQIDSCIKMFALLKLLLEDNANFAKVVKVISDNEDSLSSDNSIHSVTLNKYLNTLKLFGLNVKKEKGKYHLINPPYKLDLNRQEYNSFLLLKECASNLNEEEQADFQKFILAFERRLSERTQMFEQTRKSVNKADFSFYYENQSNKIDICSKFCKEDYKVEIIYYSTGNKKEIKIIAKAQSLLYRRNTARLQILNLQTCESTTISLDKIISIKQLPVKTSSNFTTNRITVFGLRGRLAKNYQPRTWEYTDGYRDEWLIVINRDESEEELTNRILKYGDLCKVFTPASLKEKILSTFENTLKIYE